MSVDAGTRDSWKDRGGMWVGVTLALVAVVAAIVVYALTTGGSESASASATEPATVVHVAGSDEADVTLAASAIKRLDVRTVSATYAMVKGQQRLVVPYGAVFYDPSGQTWVYTSPRLRTFVRQRVTVESIDGNRAILTAGLAVGTKVATVGVQELFGTEFDIGH